MQQFYKLIGITAALIAALLAGILWYYVLSGHNKNSVRNMDSAIAVTAGGDPAKGYSVILSSGCGSCHEISGIPGARGTIGPSLKGFKDRAMIGGVLSNSPDNLKLWLKNPRAVDAKTAMPNLNLTPEQAQDAAAYLYAH